MHRVQRKELQNKIQALKKSVTKGDRKKKKEIDTEVEKLEKDFEEKCHLELEARSKPTVTFDQSIKPDEVALKVVEQVVVQEQQQSNSKTSKSKKRKSINFL